MQGSSRFSATAVFVLLLAFAGVAQAQTTVESAPTEAVKGRKPEIATVTITGNGTGPGDTFVPGNVLTVAYTQTDPDLDAADATATVASIQWYSDGTPVDGRQGSTTYTIREEDKGKRITVRITPHTDSVTTDPYEGDAIDSLSVSATEGEGVVTIPDGTRVVTITITGDAEVGDKLTANPSCGASCDAGVSYQWQIEDAIGSGSYTDIVGETSLEYTPVGTDQKKKIRIVATNPAP